MINGLLMGGCMLCSGGLPAVVFESLCFIEGCDRVDIVWDTPRLVPLI